MKPEIIAVLAVFFAFAMLEFLRVGLFRKPGQQSTDGWAELASTLGLLLAIQPGIIFSVNTLLNHNLPHLAGALSTLPLIAQAALIIVFDDMSQYWWHRSCHRVKWLYPLHRSHHNAPYMSVRLVYRNSLLYYCLMPGIWFSAVLVFLGMGWVYAIYLVIKLTVITAAHCAVPWDKPLYKIKFLRSVMWVVERVISTPATHFAHHGKHAADGVTNYKGNYGNLLFFWDVLFGTAKITRRYPELYGVENLPTASLSEQLFWPLARHKHNDNTGENNLLSKA